MTTPDLVIYILSGLLILSMAGPIIAIIVMSRMILGQNRNLMWFSGSPGRMIAQKELGEKVVERDTKIAEASTARAEVDKVRLNSQQSEPHRVTIPPG